MAAEIIGKANNEFVNENYQKALELYTEAIELEKRDDIYTNRAQAYIKLNKYQEAIEDCNQAIALNSKNIKAFLRKGISLFYLEDFKTALETLTEGQKILSLLYHEPYKTGQEAYSQGLKLESLFNLEDYKTALEAFTQGQKLDSEDNNFRTWIRKCEAEIDLSKHETNDMSEIKIGSSGDKKQEVKKEEIAQKEVKTEQTTQHQQEAKIVPMPPKEKSRYDWYQTQTHVIVTILLKNVKQEDMTVDIHERSLSACIKLPTGSDYTLELELSHPIDPKQSVTKLLKSKIEVKLKKCEEIQWQKLEGEEQRNISRIKVEPNPVQYPSSSHYTRNWDKLAQEVKEEEKNEKKEGDAALNELFQKIYADGSDETKKAMMKSFYESGGTVLSTNWNEVGKEKVDVKPPDGMEFKKWES